MTSVVDVWIKKHIVLHGMMEDAVDYVRAHILLFVMLTIALYAVVSSIRKSLSLVPESSEAYLHRLIYHVSTIVI
jgi:hypothetical protein